jgi:KDO2-lipid IV(A) lauroyltransferase
MAESLRQFRRAATQMAVRQAITATAVLPAGLQGAAVRSLFALAGSIPPLRRRVRENMCLALGDDVPAGAERLYFHRLGWFLSSALAAFRRGLDATAFPGMIRFDETVRLLDAAIAEGRGVVFSVPHFSAHELVAATVHRTRPMVFLVRQGATSERSAFKRKWYAALGADIVERPRGASAIKDAVAYLKVLKAGKLLAITPDLLAGPGEGIETRLFGRPARLHAGPFAIAVMARAPMIRASAAWQPDDSAVITFYRAPTPDAGDREAAIRAAAQDWCRWFEARLRENPENWQFWLDKRWSRLLRETPRADTAA